MSSSIEWTDETWNPIAGCSPVSEGCRNCYAAKEAIRLGGNPNELIAAKYSGTAAMRGVGPARRAVFTGKITFDERALVKPLSWKKPRRVFVNSMSDLFHESVPFAFIDRVFAVMAATPQHTYQVLTKRPERMAEYFSDPESRRRVWNRRCDLGKPGPPMEWPLPNVWLGTSVEDQAAADARIPHLLRTPAAVRFLSCEPLLGPVDLTLVDFDGATGLHVLEHPPRQIDWVIVGGESGGGARGFNVRWARQLVDQCRAAGVAVFVKQLGARPFDTEASERLQLRDRKGGWMREWPEDLQVREFPTQGGAR